LGVLEWLDIRVPRNPVGISGGSQDLEKPAKFWLGRRLTGRSSGAPHFRELPSSGFGLRLFLD